MKKSKLVKILALSAIFTSSAAVFTACGGDKHDLTRIDEQAATCTADGHEAYYMCSHCDLIFADADGKTETTLEEVKIEKLGHDMHKHDAVGAECTKPGNVEYYTCSREPNVYYADAAGTKTLKEIGVTVTHEMTPVKQVDPTVGKNGTAAHYLCGNCHKKFNNEWGDRELTDEELAIPAVQENIDGVLTENFYNAENAYAVGGSDLQRGGIGFIMNGSLREDGVYMHVTLNHNLSAAEQTGDHGKLGIIWMIHNEDDLTHPALGVCLQQYGVTELMLDGTVKYREPYSHQLYYFNTKTNESGATTKYTTTWEFFIANNDLAEMSNGAFADAFETKDGKTTLKKGYNVLVNAIGNMTKDAAESDKFSEIENVAWCESMPGGEWYRWWKAGYNDEANNKNMVLYQDGFSENFRRYDNTVTVKSESQNATVSVAETVQFGDSLNVTVTPANGYIIASVLVNGKTYPVTSDGGVYTATIAVNDTLLKWNETELTVEPVVVKEVTINGMITATDLNGNSVSAKDINGTLTLTGKNYKFNVSVTNGAFAHTVYADEYEAFFYGYKPAALTVTEQSATVTVTLQGTFAYGHRETAVNDTAGTIKVTGSGCPQNGTPWSGYAEIVTDGTNADKSFEFIVKDTNVRNGKDDFAARRIAIQVAGNSGFFLWFNNAGEVMIRHLKPENLGANGSGQGDAYEGAEICHNHGWMKGIVENQNGDGLKFRIVRMGEKIILNAYNGSEWVRIGETSCGADDKTNFVFYAQGDDYEFSAVSVNALQHKTAVEPSESNNYTGNVEHYTDGTNFYTANGSVTTLDAVTIKQVSVTLSVTAKELDGTTPVTLANGTEIVLTGKSKDYTYTVGGANNPDKMLAGTYKAYLYGYAKADVVVPEAGGAVEIALVKTIAYGYRTAAVNDGTGTIKVTGSGCPNDGTPWSGYAEIVTDGTNADKSFGFTVKDTNVRNGAYDFAARRIAIQVAGNSGFFFWFNSDSEVMVRHLKSENLGANGSGQGGTYEGAEICKNHGWMKGMVEGNGLQFHILRYGTRIILTAYNGTDWVYIGETSCGADDKTNFVLYAQGDDYEFSAISVANVTVESVSAKAPSASETGNVAYFTDGTNYYAPQGTIVTLDELTLPKLLATPTYTFNGSEEGVATKDNRPTETTVSADGIVIATDASGDWADFEADPIKVSITQTFAKEKTVEINFNLKGTGQVWWASNRFGIEVAGTNGLFVWNNSNAGLTCGIVDETMKTETLKLGEFAWFGAAIASEDGANIKLIRKGGSIRCYAQNGSEWVYLGSVACSADDDTQIKFIGKGATWTVTDLTVSEIEAAE